MRRKRLKTGFRITRGWGFQITFENGYTVSVQFGYWNFCSCQAILPENALKKKAPYEINTECHDAEVAVLSPKGTLVEMIEFDGDVVAGYYTPEMVADLIETVRRM